MAKPYDSKSFKFESGLFAVHINADDVLWQHGNTTLYVLKSKDSSDFDKTAKQVLESLKARISGQKFDGALIAIDNDHKTVLVWLHHVGGSTELGLSNKIVEIKKTIEYRMQHDGSVHIGLDEGASVVFDSELIEYDNLMKPVIDNNNPVLSR